MPYVIRCAGSWNPKPVHETELPELRHAMTVDAMAHAVLLRELLPPMREADFGRIIAVGGEATLVPSGGWALQYAAKMALNGFVVAAALENQDRNVKINLLAPGPTNTEMYPGPLPVDASHPTVDHLLGLDCDGPTGRMFWLGHELPLFPDLGATDLGASIPDRQRLRYVLNDSEWD